MSAPLAKFMKKLDELPESIQNDAKKILEMDQECVEKRKKLTSLCRQLLFEQHPKKKSSNKASKPHKQNQYTEAMVSPIFFY